MNEKQKCVKRVELLHKADRLMSDALRLGKHHPLFGLAVCEAQMHLDDAVAWADAKQTKLKKDA